MDTTKIDICNEREGVYRIVSLYSRDSIAITSQGLLELATWIEEKKRLWRKRQLGRKEQTTHLGAKIRLNAHTLKVKGTAIALTARDQMKIQLKAIP